MNYSEEIDKAIAAHNVWKLRLQEAIDKSTSEFSVDHVHADNRCDFGHWFYGLPADLRETDQAENIRLFHAAFHAEAARIMALTLAGCRREAEQALAPGTVFARLSGQLTMALTVWKKALDNQPTSA